MGFKSLTQNNQQFKVGGLIFPTENLYKFFRDLDKEISDMILRLYDRKMTLDEVQDFFDIRDLSEISRGEGEWKQREGHNFLRLRKGRVHEKSAVKRGRVMQIDARDHVEVHPQKKKEVLYLIKKKKKKKNNGTLWI